MSKILVVDDDYAVADCVEETLNLPGMIVDVAGSAEEAEGFLHVSPYDLIILDWNLPKVSGVGFLEKIRASGSHTPVLMLTGRGSVEEKTLGLERGADDYLVKPFDSRELLARVRALLRRPARIESNNQICIDNIVLDCRTRAVLNAGVPVELTRQEFVLLEFLMKNKDEVFSADVLMDRAWSSLSESSPAVIRVHITHLRKKLRASGDDDCPIKNVHGQGYVFISRKTADRI